jgi:hypothetical protein
MAAIAANNGGSADDFEFIREHSCASTGANSEPNPFVSAKPNASICNCFRHLVSVWKSNHRTAETAEIATNDIVCVLNGGSMNGGAYRSTSIRGLLRPFIDEKLISIKESTDTTPQGYVVDVQGMIARLETL